MSSLLIIFGVSIAIIVILRLLVTALKYKADRTKHFCARCGEELFPSPAEFWSETSGWRCENCGAWGNDLTSTISLAESCRETTRQTIYQRVEAAQRARKHNAVAAANFFLQEKGLKFVEANFQSKRGKIDLIFRVGDYLVFVEVMPRSSKNWTLQEAHAWWGRRNAVRDYLQLPRNVEVKIRLDTVEVLLDWDGIVPNESGQYLCFEIVKDFRAWKAQDLRHLQNTNQVQTAPISADLSELWRKLVEAVVRLKETRPVFDFDLNSPECLTFLNVNDLMEANPISFENKILIIGLDPEFEHHLKNLDTPNNRALLQRELAKLGYANCQIRYVKAAAMSFS